MQDPPRDQPLVPAPRPAADADAAGPWTVLFVDDEPSMLSGLRRSLHQARTRWRSLVAGSAEEALAVLAREAVDVVVSDMRMQSMSGAQLLTRVRETYPGVARIILSGYTDRSTVISAIGPAQQFLIKPCQPQEILAALDRVLALRDLVTDPHTRDLLGGVNTLPAPPQIYQRITEITADPDYDLDAVIKVIAADYAATAEVLRLANSSYFGLTAHVDSLDRAVSLLGLSTIQALAVSGAAFTRTQPPPGIDPTQLTTHGLQIGGLARRIAQTEGWCPEAVTSVFMAGLLHQIGLPVLAAARPDAWAAVRTTPANDLWTEHQAQQHHLGCSVTRASAYLLGLWGFPPTVVRAVADQPARPDDPNATPAGHLLTYARLRIHDDITPPALTTATHLDQARLARWDQASRPLDTNPPDHH